MVTIRGTNVYPTAVENLLGQVDGLTPYYEIHIERRQDQDCMSVVVEAEPALAREVYPALQERAMQLLHHAIGVRIEVQVVEPQSLPRYELKSRKVIDHRRKG
jgi:phenylacetate-CoA ligase